MQKLKKILIGVLLWQPASEAVSQWTLRLETESVWSVSTPAGLTVKPPYAVALSPLGDVLLLDGGNHRLIRFSEKGEFLSQIGGFGSSETQLDGPEDVCTEDGLNSYIADLHNRRIVRYNKRMEPVSILSGDRLPGGTLGWPRSVAVSDQGDLFYLDVETPRVVRLNSVGDQLRAFGGFSSTGGALKQPLRITVSSDFVYVAEKDRIVVFDYYGNYIRRIEASVLKDIRDITASGKNLYILEDKTVIVMDEKGNVVGTSAGQTLEAPVALDVKHDRLVVYDSKSETVVRFRIVRRRTE